MKPILEKKKRQERRAKSLRRHLRKTATRPRLSVNRSSKHIFAQVIDDDSGRTLAAVGTAGKRLAADLQGKTKTERAAFVGKEIARLAREAGVKEVVFDRGHRKYHGRVKALAEAAREGGLSF